MNNYQDGDVISLKNQDVDVVECEECGHLMVNIDADQVSAGDLVTLKREGIYLSNPDTKEQICLHCEYNKPSFGQRLSTWFDDKDDEDDTPFFHSTPTPSSPSTFGGSSSFGGFGGFGGGLFSGGGASRSF